MFKHPEIRPKLDLNYCDQGLNWLDSSISKATFGRDSLAPGLPMSRAVGCGKPDTETGSSPGFHHFCEQFREIPLMLIDMKNCHDFI